MSIPVDRGSRLRATILGLLLCAVFPALLVRLYAIQIGDHQKHVDRGDVHKKGTVRINTPPGSILDAKGEPLAVSVPVSSVWADPNLIGDRETAARLLARDLGMNVEDVRRKLARADRRFIWIKRKVSETEAGEIRKLAGMPPFRPEGRLKRERLGLRTEFARRYPYDGLLAHVLGFMSADPRWHEGIERVVASYLSSPGRSVKVTLDGRRRVVDSPDVAIRDAEVRLTIDLLFQKVVEEELDAAVAKYSPKSAVAIVMDPRTGRILAMANRPGFSPAAPAAVPAEARRNRCVTDSYEPGSTLKPFLAAFALELKLATPETTYDCENGLWKHGPRRLHDHHPYGLLTLADVIIKSSNIGAAKIGVITLGRERVHQCLRAFGFGTRTGIDLPSETRGRLFPLSKWTVYTDTSVPMGHEIAVTALQLAAAMSAIANGGVLYRPYVVSRITRTDGTVLSENRPSVVRRVLGDSVSRQMIDILSRVVSEGTGRHAKIEGLAVAGKTGTTQKYDPVTRQWGNGRFISSFVGFAPAENARMCVAVVVDEPKGSYYGGRVAAPVVKGIIERGLVYVD